MARARAFVTADVPGVGLNVIGAFPPVAIVALSCATRLAVNASLNFFAPKPTSVLILSFLRFGLERRRFRVF
jgi:hypothetical protein